MQLYNLSDFKGGWFVGNFHPTLFPLESVEVSIKHYKAGHVEPKHLHREADEITVIVSGKVSMNGNIYVKDDVILIEKDEATDFIALLDTTCVVKVPSVKNDKYLV